MRWWRTESGLSGCANEALNAHFAVLVCTAVDVSAEIVTRR